MMLQGSRILDHVTTSLYGYSNPSLWMIAIAVGISLWLVVLSRHRVGVNGVVVIMLLILGLFLALRLLHGLPSVAIQASWPQVTFWQGVELNIAMSLSWLPLIGDYTQDARQKRTACGAPLAIRLSGAVCLPWDLAYPLVPVVLTSP